MDSDNEELQFEEEYIEDEFSEYEVHDEVGDKDDFDGAEEEEEPLQNAIDDSLNERMTLSNNTFTVMQATSSFKQADDANALPMNQSFNKEPKTVSFQEQP